MARRQRQDKTAQVWPGLGLQCPNPNPNPNPNPTQAWAVLPLTPTQALQRVEKYMASLAAREREPKPIPRGTPPPPPRGHSVPSPTAGSPPEDSIPRRHASGLTLSLTLTLTLTLT